MAVVRDTGIYIYSCKGLAGTVTVRMEGSGLLATISIEAVKPSLRWDFSSSEEVFGMYDAYFDGTIGARQ